MAAIFIKDDQLEKDLLALKVCKIYLPRGKEYKIHHVHLDNLILALDKELQKLRESDKGWRKRKRKRKEEKDDPLEW